MQNKKVCANCKFYHDKSCSHFWIEKPEQQTCDDFRQMKIENAELIALGDFVKCAEDAVKSGKRVWMANPEPIASALFYAENERNMNPHDAVNHPAHYTHGGIECIDALKAATVGLSGIEAVCTANAIKYLWRWKHKNGAQDIDKAIWYLNRLKQELEDGNARNESE